MIEKKIFKGKKKSLLVLGLCHDSLIFGINHVVKDLIKKGN